MGKSNCRGGRWRALALSCALALAGCCHLDHLNLKPPAPRTLFTSPVQWLPAAQFVGKAAFNSISSNFGQELYLSGYIYASGNTATAIIVRTLDGGQSWNYTLLDTPRSVPAIPGPNAGEAFALGRQDAVFHLQPSYWEVAPAPLASIAGRVTAISQSQGTLLVSALDNTDCCSYPGNGAVRGSIYQSEDAGINWQSSPNIAPCDHGANVTSSQQFVASSDGGALAINCQQVYTSIDGGKSWTLRLDAPRTTAVYFGQAIANGSIVLGLTEPAAGGGHLAFRVTGPAGQVLSDRVSPSTVVSASCFGTHVLEVSWSDVWLSNDSGSTFSQILIANAAQLIYSGTLISDHSAIVFATDSQTKKASILRTDDIGGASPPRWRDVTNDILPHAN